MDFEASSLSPRNSYPIQVAWSLPDGHIESWYINPRHVDGWDDWDFVAQHEIHGISRSFLADAGRTPAEVAQRLSRLLVRCWASLTHGVQLTRISSS